MASIHFILTGGTIDSSYYPPQETAIPNVCSIIPEYITDKIKPWCDVSFETVCMLDSDDITHDIRDNIKNAVISARAQKIIITHGTNTMCETADYLARHVTLYSDKSVILTGAMIPLKEFAMSDAGFNLGYALAQAEYVQAGVYIAMHGTLFGAGDVVKDKSQARFVHK